MREYWISMAAVVILYVIYHTCQHNIPTTVNPAASLIVTYILSLILTAGLFLVFPAKQGIVQAFRDVTWVSYFLAISVVGLEAGFLLLYRFGWKLSIAAIYANVSVTLLLIPIGIFFLKERLSWVNSMGVLFAILGIVMMNYEKV